MFTEFCFYGDIARKNKHYLQQQQQKNHIKKDCGILYFYSKISVKTWANIISQNFEIR